MLPSPPFRPNTKISATARMSASITPPRERPMISPFFDFFPEAAAPPLIGALKFCTPITGSRFGAWIFTVSSGMPAGCCGAGEASCDIFTGAPHTLQNLASSGKGFPHFEQNIISTPLACRRQKQPQLIFYPILPEPAKKRPTQSGSFQKLI